MMILFLGFSCFYHGSLNPWISFLLRVQRKVHIYVKVRALFKNVRIWRKSVRMKIALIYMKSRQSDTIFRQIVVCKFSDARNPAFHLLKSKNHEIKWKVFWCEKSRWWYESGKLLPFQSLTKLFDSNLES